MQNQSVFRHSRTLFNPQVPPQYFTYFITLHDNFLTHRKDRSFHIENIDVTV
jgi:hypothetical protein